MTCIPKRAAKKVGFFYKKIKYVGWEYVEMKFFVFSTCDIYIMLKFVDFINLSISFCTFEQPETKKKNQFQTDRKLKLTLTALLPDAQRMNAQIIMCQTRDE